MERTYPDLRGSVAKMIGEPATHLFSCFVGEGDRQNAVRRGDMIRQKGDAPCQRVCFSGAWPGYDQQVSVGVVYCLALGVVEAVRGRC